MRTDPVDPSPSWAPPSHLHWHDGTTCHGHPELKSCLKQAIEHGWIGKVLEITDTDIRTGDVVRCYSMIVGSFDHHGNRGKWVAATRVMALILNDEQQKCVPAIRTSEFMDRPATIMELPCEISYQALKP